MAAYVYVWRTSGGERREGEIDAPTRDEAFAVLRVRGIRPIKVTAKDGAKANGEMRGVRKRVLWACVLAAATLAGGVAFWAGRGGQERAAARAGGDGGAFARYREAAQAVRAQLTAGEKMIAFDRLSDWAAMEKAIDFGAQYLELEKGRQLAELLALQLKTAFADAEDGHSRALYGREMADVEALRDRMDAYAGMLALLEAEMGAWKVQDKTGVKFVRAEAQAEFESLKEAALDPAAAKWRKDFGGGISSEPVAVPARPGAEGR